MMYNKIGIFLLCVLCIIYINGEKITRNETKIVASEDDGDLIDYRKRLDNQIAEAEKALKNFLKRSIKNLLPTLMSYSDGDSHMSTKCMGAFMKYIAGLQSVKVWAIKMFDATSKPPAGLLEGTFADFGAFDQCIAIELPKRNGDIEFTGKYCAIEAKILMPPIPKNFSIAKQVHALPLDSFGEEMRVGGMAFHYLKWRFGVCVPSLCTLEDMQFVSKRIGERIPMDVKIPQCYIKESVVFKPVHIAVICIVSLLLITCIAGSVIEYKTMGLKPSEKNLNTRQNVLMCFSFISNFRHLLSASQGSEELKAVHGMKALSMAWVIMGHTYVWTNFQLLRRPYVIPFLFRSLDFGPIINGWLSVEPFFFLSGFLTSYAVLKIMPKTKGRINIPFYILKRYIRLTPPLLLVMGLVFFMPLVSSGPFWYERVDPELKSCSLHWWKNILYISNWGEMKNICVHPTWYLSADFQLYLISIIFLYLLYWVPKIGLSLLAAFVLSCTIAVGVLTHISDLPPIILISSANSKQIEETVDKVHMNTFTHAGAYSIGIVLGYLIIKYKDIKMSRKVAACGWILSALLSLTSLYGAHRWNIGESHGPLLTDIYAAVHRTTFILGVAWVAFACITGHGGIVNSILASRMLAPFGRMTYMIYLLHPLVIWVRKGSLRERTFFSHYNRLYEFAGNLIISVLLTVPFYLLLEAPISNIDRLMFSKLRTTKDSLPEEQQNGQIHMNMMRSSKEVYKTKDAAIPIRNISNTVELKSVKNLENIYNNNVHVPTAA